SAHRTRARAAHRSRRRESSSPWHGALTIEGIAARSGAGKPTIYRWWGSKAEVVLDALLDRAAVESPLRTRVRCPRTWWRS
ncbi:helix-turn-helix domain-containing protein, partial [Nonomuraea sp. NPDC049784]|uniref:helix-turn-helix domain-containing protein n=1 Tax=Nonomuraea sp. NPDC049784 TaxID=3154361 RepID=UPI0033DA9E71